MNSRLVVVINGQSVIEYDRNRRLPGHQRQFLDRMDLDMDAGIELAGQQIDSPEMKQRAQYIAMHLINAVLDNNDAVISAMCAWLANRLPELKQIVAIENNSALELELVFDREYTNQIMVAFTDKFQH